MSSVSRARRRAFVQAYISNGGNARAAAESCGLSAATSRQSGSRMLAHPEVKLALAAHLKEAASDASTTALVRRLAKIAHSQPDIPPTYRDINQAARTLLQVNGALQGNTSHTGLTVQIGFLTREPDRPTERQTGRREPTALPAAAEAQVVEADVVNMGSTAHPDPGDPSGDP